MCLQVILQLVNKILYQQFPVHQLILNKWKHWEKKTTEQVDIKQFELEKSSVIVMVIIKENNNQHTRQKDFPLTFPVMNNITVHLLDTPVM